MWHSQDRQQNRQTFGQKVSYPGKSVTSRDMSRAGSVMLGARTVMEQSSLVNETHLLTPKSLMYSSRLVKKKLGVAWGREHPFRIQLGSRKVLGSRREKGWEPLL